MTGRALLRTLAVVALACVAVLTQTATADSPKTSDSVFSASFAPLLEAKTYAGIGVTPGVRTIAKEKGTRVMALGPELEPVFRRLRGRRTILWCSPVPLSGEEPAGSMSGGMEHRLPKRRVDFRPVIDPFNERADVCTLALRAPATKSPPPGVKPDPEITRARAIASVAVTSNGATALDRWGPAQRLAAATALVDEESDVGGGVVAMSGLAGYRSLVPLSGPGADPPEDGRIGVWTDGKEHRYVAVRTPLGHVFSSERNGEMLSENTGYWLESFADFS